MNKCLNTEPTFREILNVRIPLRVLQFNFEEFNQGFIQPSQIIPGVYIPTAPVDQLPSPAVFIPTDISRRPFIVDNNLTPVSSVELIPNRPGIPGVIIIGLKPNVNLPIFIPELPIDSSLEGVFIPGIPGNVNISKIASDLSDIQDLTTDIITDFLSDVDIINVDPFEPTLPNYNSNYVRPSVFIPLQQISFIQTNNSNNLPGVYIPGSLNPVSPANFAIDLPSSEITTVESEISEDIITTFSTYPGAPKIELPILAGDRPIGIFIPNNPLIPPFIPGYPYTPSELIPDRVNQNLGQQQNNSIPDLPANTIVLNAGITISQISISTPNLPVPSLNISPGSLGVLEQAEQTEISIDEFTRLKLIVVKSAHESLREVNRLITSIISKIKTFTPYLDKYIESEGLNFVNQANVTRYEIIESAVTNSINTAETLIDQFKGDNDFYKSFWEIPFKYDSIYERTQERTKEIYQNNYSTANIIMSHVTQGNKVDFRAGRVINQATHFINLAKAEVQNYAPIITTISEVVETQSVSNRLTSDEIESNSMTLISRTSEQQELISDRYSHISKIHDERSKFHNTEVEENKTTIVGKSEDKQVGGTIKYSSDGVLTLHSNTKIVLSAPQIVLNAPITLLAQQQFRSSSFQTVKIKTPKVPTIPEEELKPYYERMTSQPSNPASSGYADIPRDTDNTPPPTIGSDGSMMSRLVTPNTAAGQYG